MENVLCSKFMEYDNLAKTESLFLLWCIKKTKFRFLSLSKLSNFCLLLSQNTFSSIQAQKFHNYFGIPTGSIYINSISYYHLKIIQSIICVWIFVASKTFGVIYTCKLLNKYWKKRNKDRFFRNPLDQLFIALNFFSYVTCYLSNWAMRARFYHEKIITYCIKCFIKCYKSIGTILSKFYSLKHHLFIFRLVIIMQLV